MDTDKLAIFEQDGALSQSAIEIQERQSKVDSIFRELALRDVSRVQDHVSELLASKIQEVKRHRPDLTDVEVVMVAGRILKQMIACYQSELTRLL